MKTFLDFGIQVTAGAGGEVSTTCPQCSQSRRKKNAKCLRANVDEGVWLCHHCGWSGSLKEGGKRSMVDHWQKPKYRKPEPVPQVALDTKILDWFVKRGISPATLQAYGITSGRVYMPQLEDEANCIVYPYLREGETVNHKYRDGQKNFRMDAGAERVFFAMQNIGKTTVIVEGEADVLALHEAGIKAISVPDGAPSLESRDYSSKFEFLQNCEKQLAGVEKFILAVDSDEPGRKLEDELARRLGREKCLRVRWPEGCKDANEVLVTHGKDALTEFVNTAKPFPIKGVFEVLDLSKKIDHLYEHGFERGVSTGWHDLDDYYTVRPGELTVVSGIPNSGKSNFIDALTVNLAKHHGWNIGIFSPENQPLEDHMSRIIEKYEGKPFDTGPTERMSQEELDHGKDWAQKHFTWILPDDDLEWAMPEILNMAKSLVYRKGIRGLVIDPWNELEHERPDGMTETEYTSKTLKNLRQFGRIHGVHIWLIAHPTKLYRSKDGEYPVPTLYDISGSAHFRNKADNGLVIWRDFGSDKNEVEVHVQKIRFRQIGKIGMCSLRYAPCVGTYSSTLPGDKWRRSA